MKKLAVKVGKFRIYISKVLAPAPGGWSVIVEKPDGEEMLRLFRTKQEAEDYFYKLVKMSEEEIEKELLEEFGPIKSSSLKMLYLKLAERLIDLSEELIKLGKGASLWETFMKLKGNHALSIDISELEKIAVAPPPDYPYEEFIQKGEIEGVPKEYFSIMKRLINEGKGGGTVLKTGCWFSTEDSTIIGTCKLGDELYIACLPDDSGNGYGFWLEGKKVWVDYIQTFEIRTEAEKTIKSYPGINRYIFYVIGKLGKVVPFDEFIGEK